MQENSHSRIFVVYFNVATDNPHENQAKVKIVIIFLACVLLE